MTESRGQLRAMTTGRILVARLEIADTPWKRAIGLLGRKTLASDSGLWIEPCNGIHTLFMGFPVDVLFLDAQRRALRIVSDLAPWRWCGPVRRARIVVELPAGTLAVCGAQVGEQYVYEPTVY